MEIWKIPNMLEVVWKVPDGGENKRESVSQKRKKKLGALVGHNPVFLESENMLKLCYL
jgi:hypothetical protein